MKTTRILAISVLVLVVGLPAGVAKDKDHDKWAVDDRAVQLDVRYVDAYFVIDCYMDSNGDTWLLCWDYVLDDVVWCLATGNKEISVGGGGGVPTESISVSQPGGGATGPTRAK